MPLSKYVEFVMRAEPMFKEELSSMISGKFGLHEYDKAIDFYMKNMSKGKVIIQPSLTPSATRAKL